MIRVISQGGLGNQLFCLAFIHYLRNKTDKKIVLSSLNHKTNESLLVEEFLDFCQHEIYIKKDPILNTVLKIRDKIAVTLDSNLPDKILGMKNFVNVHEYEIVIDEHGIYRGFFQSSELIQEIKSSFVNELQMSVEKKTANSLAKIGKLAKMYDAIHIRRGDYVNGKDVYGLLSYKYYDSLISNQKNLVISTDDKTILDSIRNHFPDALVIDPQHCTAIEAFVILSRAKKLYTANSTFSWWAGIVANQFGAVVYCPEPWYKKDLFLGNQLKNSNFHYRTAIFE